MLALFYERRDDRVLCLHNFAEEPRDVTVALEEASSYGTCSGARTAE